MLDTKNINKETFEKALKDRASREDLHILIVEDQKFSRLMLKNFLAKTYQVTDVSTGEEALATYIESAPDIVLLDIELPGVDGHQVRELLVKLDPEGYVVMVTANNYKEDVERATKGGAMGFITKPYTKDKVYECIENYIESKQEGEVDS